MAIKASEMTAEQLATVRRDVEAREAIGQLADARVVTNLAALRSVLSEIDRLRAVEALNVGAIDASLTRLGATVGTVGPMPVDVFAALHAAEEAVLVAGGRKRAAPDEYGGERWDDGRGSRECTMVALSVERRRHEERAEDRAAKIGGAS